VNAVRQAFRDQADACAALGSPLMQRLMAGLAERLSIGPRPAPTPFPSASRVACTRWC